MNQLKMNISITVVNILGTTILEKTGLNVRTPLAPLPHVPPLSHQSMLAGHVQMDCKLGDSTLIRGKGDVFTLYKQSVQIILSKIVR